MLTVLAKERDSQSGISDVIVSLVDNSLSIVLSTGITDYTGHAILNYDLDINQSYYIILNKVNYVFSSMNISANHDVDVEIEGYPIDFNPIESASLVKVHGFVKDVFNNPLIATKVIVKLTYAPQVVNTNIYDNINQEILTDEAGYFEVVVAGGLNLTIVIPRCKFQKSKQLPLFGTVTLSSFE